MCCPCPGLCQGTPAASMWEPGCCIPRLPHAPLTPAHALPTGCLPHHQPAALLQAGKGGTTGHSMALPSPVPQHGCAQLCSSPSISSTLAQPQHWPSCPCTAVVPMAKPVPSAAWPGTHTAPGMATPAPVTCPTPRGMPGCSAGALHPAMPGCSAGAASLPRGHGEEHGAGCCSPCSSIALPQAFPPAGRPQR